MFKIHYYLSQFNYGLKDRSVPMSLNFLNVRSHSYFQYKYNTDLEKVINRQIQAEQQAAQDYLGMAVALLHPTLSRPGAGAYFMKMYKEELGHMQIFINYQLMRGGTPLISELKAPTQCKDLKLLAAFNQALCMEKSVTELLEEAACIAEGVKDYQCTDFITSKFLTEQMQAINELSNHITKLTRLGDNEHALYYYDLQLAKDHSIHKTT